MKKQDLKNYVPKGGLEGFPKEIISRMLDYQEEQGNPRDITVFERRVVARQCEEGFDWHDTKEDWDFWHKVINNKNFDFFFERYPKQYNQYNSQDFRVDDLENYIPKGDLEGFPKEIISRMLDCQEEQGNPKNITVFEKQIDTEQYDKGFDWYDTKEGWEFWCKVIREKDFNLFFEKYPKKDNPQDFRVDDLENYIPKGGLECFPKEIIARMLDCQEEQGNPRDVTVFERNEYSALDQGGFDWDTTIEKGIFWSQIISANNFNLFFEKYPKKDNQDNSQYFRVDDLENYIPKGDLEGFPKEIISRMLDCQEEQGNPRDISIFEETKCSILKLGGFDWDKTKEGYWFWHEVIRKKNFNLFFKKYPKKDNPQDFRINDKVYDILLKEVGIVQDIVYSSSIPYGLSVEFKSGVKSYTINGCYIPEYKNPHLLHYRDDYNYDVIDFNNLPKRQETKSWRAEIDRGYYFICFQVEGWFYASTTKETDSYYDNINYNSGNYFRTEIEAEIIAQKLNEYFKQLIKEEHERN